MSQQTNALQWQYVIRRFSRFLDNITITANQLADGTTKHQGVRSCLNSWYYGYASDEDNSLLIGSWGKETRVRPSRDVDILFLLPMSEYHRFQERSGNRQSQLLQEVKDVLGKTYSQTAMRGDGQVVVVPFNTTPIEVSPGFRMYDGSILGCDANGGGRYVTSTAEAEAADLGLSDRLYDGSTRHLARMFKQWQRHCNVPLKSFWIERLAVQFMSTYQHASQSFFYYDWFCRDFLEYIIRQANGSIIMPGTYDVIWIGDDWLSKARSAHANALRACEHERENSNILAGLYWQDIFGTMIPSDAA
ncbi:SMODS domain-containing nucleotidyltransferase [Methylobacterium radiotolerans]|uniref:SMODS domain-containing nucleotidyltransferase n=1 Tax=Methylobacterium radiotolerans TaxID=31998 RepID=UPI000977A61A|nr:nucleotidyltransferase [Methylobacterium radiotolerans]ONF47349.1 hypothetical protein RSM1_19870 [Methylobacterium radiotolerans]